MEPGVEHPRERDEWACTALPLACAVRIGETVTSHRRGVADSERKTQQSQTCVRNRQSTSPPRSHDHITRAL